MGRAADCILRNSYDTVSIFVSALLSECIIRIAKRGALPKEKFARKISQLDETRTSFYSSFLEQKWGETVSHDLCFNIGRVGETAAVGLIL